jgi:hypothetical protein
LECGDLSPFVLVEKRAFLITAYLNKSGDKSRLEKTLEFRI